MVKACEANLEGELTAFRGGVFGFEGVEGLEIRRRDIIGVGESDWWN